MKKRNQTNLPELSVLTLEGQLIPVDDHDEEFMCGNVPQELEVCITHSPKDI